MSRVFLAEELRFGRKVVIKVLPPDVSGAISAERFEREIQLVARLQHPHILPAALYLACSTAPTRSMSVGTPAS